MKQIAAALLKAQKQMGNATKDSSNPFFRSKYADLNSIREACMPHLNENGIVVLQPTVSVEGKNYVKTLLLHDSGETIEGFTEIIYSKQNDAQSQGSGITYARRYGLQSLVNVGAEDDDGNKASNPIAKPVSKITDEQVNLIDSLLINSSLPEEKKEQVERECSGYSFEKANLCIERLKESQINDITHRGTGSQTQILNELKKMK
jgi:hypothetical protein